MGVALVRAAGLREGRTASRVCAWATHALIGSKVPRAKDFTNQRVRRDGEIDEVQRGITSISDPSKYMLVAGAVAGGGLTVIANAPNPRAWLCSSVASLTNRSELVDLFSGRWGQPLWPLLCFCCCEEVIAHLIPRLNLGRPSASVLAKPPNSVSEVIALR